MKEIVGAIHFVPSRSIRPGDSRAHPGDHRGMDDADLEQLLASYNRMCEQAGIAPLPDDEARQEAMLGALLPAFEVEFWQH